MNGFDSIYIDSVSEVTEKIKDTLEDSPLLRYVRVCGEISDIRVLKTRFSTEYYRFVLKDKNSQLSAVMFEGLENMDFSPQKGDMVVCEGAVTVYAPYGQYQLKCYSMRQYGEGDAAAALKKLKIKLEAEGLFSQHRKLPSFPKKIAVVTSASGAVLHDIINIVSRRFPITKICLIPANVQGKGADISLCAGIRKAQNVGADLIIFGRGGGSSEDLDCFNSEALAREIYASAIPTISAVGHMVDYTIADLTADVRAATPSEAAELAVPDKARILSLIDEYGQEVTHKIKRKIMDRERELIITEKDIKLNSPKVRLAHGEERLTRLMETIGQTMRHKLDNAELVLQKYMQSISDTNPMTVLSRGYSAVLLGDKIISSAEELSKGDEINIKFSKGSVKAEVKTISDV